MTKLARCAAITAALALSLFTPSAHAQKLAVVDINTVVSAMPEYIAANQKIEALRTTYTDSMKTMQTQYQAKQDTYTKLGETASADMKKKEQEDLAALEQQFSTFRDAKFGQEGELAQMQQNLMKPITDKLQNTLESYAKKEHYTMLLPKTATVFVDPSMDVTTKFQEYLKEQK